MSVLVAIVVGVLWTCSRQFRADVKRALLGVAVLVGVVLIWTQIDAANRAQAEALASTRLPASHLTFDLRMDVAGRSPLKHLSGRVLNTDPTVPLERLELRLRISECETPQACTIVGETTKTVLIDVPPGQARELSKDIDFPDLALVPRATRSWSYEIVSVSGGEAIR